MKQTNKDIIKRCDRELKSLAYTRSLNHYLDKESIEAGFGYDGNFQAYASDEIIKNHEFFMKLDLNQSFWIAVRNKFL